jgi:glucokinase
VTRTRAERPAPIVAIDLGGTRLRVALAYDLDRVELVEAVPTPPDDPGVLARVAARAATTAAAAGAVPAAVVVAVPGIVDYAARAVPLLPNLPRWHGGVSAAALEAATGQPVLLGNDADLAALGEQRAGAGRGTDDMVYVTCSTGVGAGVILGGRLLHGARSLGEVGQTVIDWHSGDTVEQLGSGSALARVAGDDPAAVTARAAAGDPRAREQLAAVAAAFATGVLTLAYCFMPQRIVVGGGVAAGAGALLLDPVRARLAAAGPYLALGAADVVAAALGDAAALHGARALWDERNA